MASPPTVITTKLIDDVCRRLAENRPVRRTLPDGGRLHIDRQLPFLVVSRPGEDVGDVGRFVKGEASYLVAPSGARHRSRVAQLVERVTSEMVDLFGACLVIEAWSGPAVNGAGASGALPRPAFRVIVPRTDAEEPSVLRLIDSLGRVTVQGRVADVELVPGGRLSPPGLPRLTRRLGARGSPVRFVGVEIKPLHRDAEADAEFPIVARSLHRQLSRAFQRAAYEFALHETTHRPRHYQAVGRRAFVKAAVIVDSQLATVASSFDLLLSISPVNLERAYRSFVGKRASVPPRFLYRPLDVDPAKLKLALYRIQTDRVEDPTLAALFLEKQRELSLKLDLLSDRNTARFLHTGIALYGDVATSMVDEATTLLEQLPPSKNGTARRRVDAEHLGAAARAEIDRYRSAYPALGAAVEIRDDVTSLMVSSGSLLVGSGVRIPQRRVEALIQHEVGTHVVTYWNGASQRLQLLATGLAGHDELQEGLAVLAEYLVAGLSKARLRTLAARVVAARAVRDGAQFVDTYELLTRTHGFGSRAGFQIAARVHRGGGFVKDAVYLRGLHRVVRYLAEGGRLDTLLVGKISVDHVPIVEELQRRGVLTPPPLRPSYLDDPDSHYRLERLRDDGLNLVDLAESR